MALASAARWGDRPALVDGDQVLSFADVRNEMLQVAEALIGRGVKPGPRVAVWAPNCARSVTIALGIQAAGAWMVPLNTRLRGKEAAYMLNRVEAHALFTVDGFLDNDYAATGIVSTVDTPDGPLRIVGSPILIDGERPRLRIPPPGLGEHTTAVLNQLDASPPHTPSAPPV